MIYQTGRPFAETLDAQDQLKAFREQFVFPVSSDGTPKIYFCGNSLGLQPKQAQEAVNLVMQDWATRGVDGHFEGKRPWKQYHRHLADQLAHLVGALPSEVTVMNTLTADIHFLFFTFYQPVGRRYKILMEYDAFPSDRYAVESLVEHHGYDPEDAIIYLTPSPGQFLLDMQDIKAAIDIHAEDLAMIWLGNVNYYTGQYYHIGPITEWGHQAGAVVGFDLAHAAGNIPLQLHYDHVDFAAWCTYKYLNGGPGSLAGIYIRDNHSVYKEPFRLKGWWGQDINTRFNMRAPFHPERGAEGWQMSNQPILSMAPLYTSLELFIQAGMASLRSKSLILTGYLEYLLHKLDDPHITIITPVDPEDRGCQLSIHFGTIARQVFEKLIAANVVVDYRHPDVIRIAPVPLYNSYTDVWNFVDILARILQELK